MTTTFATPLPIMLSQLLFDESLPVDVAGICIKGITLDSRKVCAGDLFVALSGHCADGRHYIDQAIDKGAAALLQNTNDHAIVVEKYRDRYLIGLPLLQEKLSTIAGAFYQHPSCALPVVGITGTNGKTTCTQLYAQLATLVGRRGGVIGTMGYGYCGLDSQPPVLALTSTGLTTPNAIETQRMMANLLSHDCQTVAIEVSSHGLVQHRVAGIDINVAVLTNLSHDHLDYHQNMAAYAEAKLRLFSMASVRHVVLNLDDAFSTQVQAQLAEGVEVLSYSLSNMDADFYLSDVAYFQGALRGHLHTPVGCFVLSTALVGEFNLSNLLAVVATAYICLPRFSQVVEQLPYLQPVKGRMERIGQFVDPIVVVDYAHTPEALYHALDAVKAWGERIVCVFGCGGERDKQKRPLMAKVAEEMAEKVIVTSDNPRHENPQAIVFDIEQGFSQCDYQVIIDRAQAIEAAISQAVCGDVVVIAGKGHEEYQQVGGDKLPFSDQEVAHNVLLALKGSA